MAGEGYKERDVCLCERRGERERERERERWRGGCDKNKDLKDGVKW